MTDFLSIADHSPAALRDLLELAVRLKRELKQTGRNAPLLVGKTLAMVFEKPSLRTRVSFTVAAAHLGGTAIVLKQDEVGLGTREPVRDVARVLAGMCDGIVARTFEHEKVLELAKFSSVPVINGLTDYSHPCQAMADLMTLAEHFGGPDADAAALVGRTLAYVGDANNVARSLALACGKFGVKFAIASPPGHGFSDAAVAELKSQVPNLRFESTADPRAAVADADAVVTDTWVSMGQEAEKAAKVKAFAGYAVDSDLLSAAPDRAVVLHCLPAYRGYEISEGVFESPRSLVFQEAENRLHFQKGLIARLMGGA